MRVRNGARKRGIAEERAGIRMVLRAVRDHLAGGIQANFRECGAVRMRLGDLDLLEDECEIGLVQRKSGHDSSPTPGRPQDRVRQAMPHDAHRGGASETSEGPVNEVTCRRANRPTFGEIRIRLRSDPGPINRSRRRRLRACRWLRRRCARIGRRLGGFVGAAMAREVEVCELRPSRRQAARLLSPMRLASLRASRASRRRRTRRADCRPPQRHRDRDPSRAVVKAASIHGGGPQMWQFGHIWADPVLQFTTLSKASRTQQLSYA